MKKSKEFTDQQNTSTSKIKEILSSRKVYNTMYYQVMLENNSEKCIAAKDIKDKSLVRAYEAKITNGNKKKGSSTFSRNTRARKFSLPSTSTLQTSLSGKKNPKKKMTFVSSENKTSRNQSKLLSISSSESTKSLSESSNTLQHSAQGEERYYVEKIVDHRDVNGVRKYRIRWYGYSSEEDTWQTADTFDNPDFVIQYDAKVARTLRIKRSSNNSKEKSGESATHPLLKLMRTARKGVKYNVKEINGVFAMYLDDKNEKFYLTQLVNKELIFLHHSDVPSSLKNDCKYVEKKKIIKK